MLDIRPEYPSLARLLRNRLFRIPHYQRAYSWEADHRKDMFEDISSLRGDDRSFHFMGTVVGLRRDTRRIVSDEYNEIEIVDGQQRITTIVLLLKTIEKKLDPLDDVQAQEALDLRKLLVKQDAASLILLQTNHDTSQYFANYLRHGVCPPVSDAQTLADRKLLSAIHECNTFVDEWDNRIELLGLIKNQLKFIFHEINDEASVYTVFEVLNNRGLHVSWLDRLKSKLMKAAFEDNHGNATEHIYELHQIWGEIFEAIGLQQGLSTESLRFAATLKSPFQISKPLSEKRSVDCLLEGCREKAAEAISVSKWLGEVTNKVNQFLEDTSHSREAVTKIVHARLLAVAIILRNFPPDQEKKLLDQWEKTSFRIFGLCRKDARTGVGDYVRLAWDTFNTELNADDIADRMQNISEGQDHDIESTLRQIENSNCYEGWEDELRYLLFRYEEHLAKKQGQAFGNEQWDRIWRASAAKSIEHILPQSRGSQEPLENQDDVFVHRLGNLLLLPPGLNSALQDRKPSAKANDYRNTGLLIAVEVAQTIERDGWTIKEIERREQELLDWIQSEFRFEPVVSSDEEEKSQRQDTSVEPSLREERYREYFQRLSDELNARRIFTRGHPGARKNRYYFPSGIRGGGNLKVQYRAAFAGFGRSSKVSASIYMDGDDREQCFFQVENLKSKINVAFGGELEWERHDEKKYSTISVYRDGDIDASDSELEEIREWHIQNLSKLKEVFTPEIKRALETIDNDEL